MIKSSNKLRYVIKATAHCSQDLQNMVVSGFECETANSAGKFLKRAATLTEYQFDQNLMTFSLLAMLLIDLCKRYQSAFDNSY